MATANKVLERVKVREVAGVFRSRDLLDAAVSALLSSGFDRADVDVVVGAEARERLGGAKIAAEELPVVLMSGYSEQEAAARFAGRGLAGFLAKPFRIEELMDRVRAALGR